MKLPVLKSVVFGAVFLISLIVFTFLTNRGNMDMTAKMEDAINKIDGVENANVSFMRQRLTIEADESILSEIIEKAQKICKKIEPDCRICF